MAQIIQERRKKVPEKTEEQSEKQTEAIDPICGMTVNVARARHSAEVEGRTYYFCCAGCRTKFLQVRESK
jgi:YHS domain-containing protein